LESFRQAPHRGIVRQQHVGAGMFVDELDKELARFVAVLEHREEGIKSPSRDGIEFVIVTMAQCPSDRETFPESVNATRQRMRPSKFFIDDARPLRLANEGD